MSIQANYHTHTPRCMHAVGSEEEYIETAIRAGYDLLGFSDHGPWPFPEYVSHCRMTASQLPEYVDTIRRLQDRYADKIRLRLGLEIEYAPDYMDWLRDTKKEFGLDYLIFGNHFQHSEEDNVYFGATGGADEFALSYEEHAIKAMESGLYNCMAHPDLFLNSASGISPQAERTLHNICKAAVKYDMPLEYNMLGEQRRLHPRPEFKEYLGYTLPQFWQIAAQYPVKAIIGCDAHEPEALDVMPRRREIRAMLEGMGITVLDTLPGVV